MEFLAAAFGFVANGVYTDENDPTLVVHAQMDWPPGGGIMLGSSRNRAGDEAWVDSTGRSQCYCVTETDEDVDRIHAQAVVAGATSVRAPEDQGCADVGARSATPRATSGDFGSYRGE